AILAVASNKYNEATKKIISHFFPQINFIAVLGQRDGIPIKPDAHVIHEIIDLAKVSPEETIYVGDSVVDASTAADINGITYICVTWGFCHREELEKYGIRSFVSAASEIWNIYSEN
ncbi:MAG: HAD hydrolase-like protein, partial [Bacteroidales bacterium]